MLSFAQMTIWHAVFANQQVVFNTKAGVYNGIDSFSACKCYVYTYTQISENAIEKLFVHF